MPDRIVIRADGGPEIGHGHVLRCLALAQAWRERGGDAVFVGSLDDALAGRLAAAGFERRPLPRAHPDPADLDATLRAIEEAAPVAVVLDGYHLDGGYQRAVRRSGYCLLVVDDTAHLDRYDADAVLNQNLGAEELHYRANGARLLLGPRYVLLRRAFARWRGRTVETPERARTLLLTLGGGEQDAARRTALAALEGLGLDVLLAAGRPPDEMPELMAQADLAVTGAGSTCWELAFMGVPMVAVSLADNQGRNARELAARGAAVTAPLREAELRDAVAALADDPGRRAALSAAGRALVDGEGADRVAAFLAGAAA